MKLKVTFAIAAVFAAGAILSPLVVRNSGAQNRPGLEIGRYQVTALANGQALGVDTATGTTWVYTTPTGWTVVGQLPDAMPAYLKQAKP